jgi:3D (Asp-Asp-Asp) domain-containing protein
MGNQLGYGIVAVDPSVIPLGSKVYVTSADGSWTYGVASAEDTGGAIKGNKIDLCYSGSSSDVNGFGRRSCVVYILE